MPNKEAKKRKPYTTAQALKGKVIVNVTVPPISPSDPVIGQILEWLRDDSAVTAERFEWLEREVRAQRKAYPITEVPGPTDTEPRETGDEPLSQMEWVEPGPGQAGSLIGAPDIGYTSEPNS